MKKLCCTLLFVVTLSTGCSQIGSALNPFQEPPAPEAFLGAPNDNALNGSSDKIDSARSALNAMASYERAHYPKPYNPVMKPPVVRLMWVPDHVNRHGDLVPAHYYYLKVKSADWAVQDAFELEAQLHGPGHNPETSNIPWAESSR